VIQTFKRYELKYRIDGEQWNNLIPVLQKHMNLDEYCQSQGSYKIYNIYFDNDTDEIIRHSLTKPYYKEKLRLRSYQIPLRADDPIFFEIKKKIGGVVNKRRAITTLSQAIRFSESGLITMPNEYKDRQVLAEIQKFIWRYQAKPKVFLSYERVAYFEKGNPNLRVSLDSHILSRRNQVLFTGGDYGTPLLQEGEYIMEIKCEGHIPLWLSQQLSKQRVFRTGFSKYGTEYKKYSESKLFDFAKTGVEQYVR